jgi:hypothetical protein
LQREREDPPNDEPRIHDNWFDDDPGNQRRRKKRPKRR